MNSIWNRITGFYHPTSPKEKSPRLGLSIDSDSSSPESDESSIEEGLPLWSTTPTVPSHLLLPSAPKSNNSLCQQQHQILPRRGAALSLDSEALTSEGARAQRLLNHPSFLSLPVLPSNTNTDSTKHNNNEFNQRIRLQQKPQEPRDDFYISSFEQTSTTSHNHNNDQNYIVIPKRLFKLLLTSVAMLMIGLSSSNEIIVDEQPSIAKTIEFPDYILSPPPPVYTSKPHFARSHRSNLALARQQQSRPVFETAGQFPISSYDNSLLLDQSSPSDLSWMSWIGGFGLFLIALETGWKGYKKSKFDAEQERRL